MKRLSIGINEISNFNKLRIDKNNIDSLKMLTHEIDPDVLEIIRKRDIEKNELNQAANLVKDFVKELKEEMTNNYNNDDEKCTLLQNNKKNKINKCSINNIEKKNIGNNFLHFSQEKIRRLSENNGKNDNIFFPSLNNDIIKRKKSASFLNNFKSNNEEIDYINNSPKDSITINNLKSLKKPSIYFDGIHDDDSVYKSINSSHDNITLKSSLKKKNFNHLHLNKYKKIDVPQITINYNNNNGKKSVVFIEQKKSFKTNKTFKKQESLSSIKSNSIKYSKSYKSIKSFTPKNKNKLNNIIFQNEIDNNDIPKLPKLSSKNILLLNDIKKELKNSFIGERVFTIKKEKNYLLDNLPIIDINIIEQDEEKINKEDKEQRYRNLQYKANVYDSLDDEENIDDQINLIYIHPDSFYVILLDFLVTLCSIYNIIYIPFFLGYNNVYCIFKFFNFHNIIELFVDVIYFCDFILPFFVAFYNFDEVLNIELNVIAKKYLKEWFILDLIQAIPFKTFLSLFDKKCKNIDFQTHPFYNNNMVYLLISLRLLKIIKVVRNNKFVEKIINRLNETNLYNNYLKIYKNFCIFLICIHIVSNIFIFIGKNDYPNWIINNKYEKFSYLKLYMISIYFTIETLTTVGYGDLTFTTPREKLFGLFMEIVGIFAYSWAISHISNYFKIINEKTEDYEKNLKILNNIKNTNPKLPNELYDRIFRFLKYKHESIKLDNKIIFDSLPNGLSNLLVYEMYKPIIKNFIFFKHFDNIDFIVKVVLNLIPTIAIKNDVLIKEGELVEDIIFVKKGKLSLELPLILYSKSHKNTLFKNTIILTRNKSIKENNTIIQNNLPIDYFELFSKTKNKKNINEEVSNKQEENIQIYKILDIRKNEHFGDILMFLNLRSPLSLRTKTKKAELFYLNKTAAVEISMSFPSIWKKINKRSLFNYEQIRRLVNKIIKIFNVTYGISYNKMHSTNEFDIQNSSIYESIDESELKSIPSNIDSNFDNESYKNDTNLRKLSILKKKSDKTLNTIKEIDDYDNYAKINTNIYNNYDDNNYSTYEKKVIIEENEDDISNYQSKDSLTNGNGSDSKTNIVSLNSILNTKSNKLTPFTAEEINNEIYPNENCFFYKNDEIKELNINDYKIKTSYDNYNLLYRKTDIGSYINYNLNKNISICSTEISFSLNSEYENLNELSDYQYSKNLKLRQRVNKILKKEYTKKESDIEFNLDNISRESLNSEINFKRKLIGKRRSISYFKSFNQNINIFQKYNSALEKEKDRDKDKGKFKSKNIQNLILYSPTEKNQKKRINSKYNLLSTINKNIERNQINLNNPDLFYSEYFHKILDKKKTTQKEGLKKEEEELMNKLQRKTTFSKINSLKNI